MTDERYLPRTGFEFSRRAALGMFGATALGAALPPARVIAQTSEGEEIIVSHGYSFYGDLKYPEGFKHFDYVNPNAPKGGQISLGTRGTFDGFNRWAWRGNAESNSGIVAEAMFGEMPWGCRRIRSPMPIA